MKYINLNTIENDKILTIQEMKNVKGRENPPATCVVCCGPCGSVNLYNSSDCGTICGPGSWMCHPRC